MKIKIGNSIDLIFSVKDSNGDVVTNLSTAIAIKFMVKLNELDADLLAKISKTLGSGIVVDSPSIGDVKVSLSSTDTKIAARKYFMALQIEWPTYIQEVNIKETANEIVEINTVDFIQDIIR